MRIRKLNEELTQPIIIDGESERKESPRRYKQLWEEAGFDRYYFEDMEIKQPSFSQSIWKWTWAIVQSQVPDEADDLNNVDQRFMIDYGEEIDYRLLDGTWKRIVFDRDFDVQDVANDPEDPEQQEWIDLLNTLAAKFVK